MRPVFAVAVEGPTDAAVVGRVLASLGAEVGPVHIRGGKAGVDDRIRAYNQAARHGPWLVVRDLDRDAPCAGALVERLIGTPADLMCFRIAVRQVESWLLADRERIAAFLGIAASVVPGSPDSLDDPKATLVELAARSRSRDIREDIVPRPGSRARVGPGYLARVAEFAGSHWRPAAAARSSPSLAGCVRALKRVMARGAPRSRR